MEQRPYQRDGSAFLAGCERGILADEPGLGKTNQAICASSGRTLVVAPAALVHNWRAEVEMWRRPGQEFEVTSYSRLARREGSRTFPTPRPEYQGFETVIYDECHNLKGRTANWTRAAMKVKSERAYLLSGTPMSGWAHELWPLLRIVHSGDRRYSSFWRWVAEWFETWRPPWGGTEVRGLRPGVSWDDFAAGCGLESRWLRREMDLVLDELPAMSYQTIELDMAGAQATAYRQLRKSMVAELEAGLLVSWSSGDQFVKLAQLATSVGAVDGTFKPSGAKMDALRELLVGRSRPVVCFTHFRSSATVVAAVARELGLVVAQVDGSVAQDERATIIQRFQAFEVDVLVGTFATMSEGVTLTAADTAIFVERSPRALYNFQAERRIRRFGQDRPTRRIDLVTRQSVDERLVQRLAAKGDQETKLVEALDLLT